MSAHVWTRLGSRSAAGRQHFRLGFGAGMLLSLLLLTSGCAQPPAPALAGPDPVDASSPVSRVGYRSVIGSYKSRRPVEPAPWGEQNERVAPAPRSGQ